MINDNGAIVRSTTGVRGDAIVIPEITANNFEIKHGLLNLVQNKQFFGNDKEDPHAHIRYFNKITSTMKILNVPNTSVKLMLFPFSLEGAARIWLEKEPPRSIETWDDLIYRPPVNQPVAHQPVAHQGPAPQTHGVSKTDFERYVTANDAVLRNMQNQGQNLQSQMANLTDMLSKFVTANTASTSGSGTLPGNTVTNPKEDLKAVILNKLPKKLGDPGRFLIPCEFTGITTCNALADLGASINLMPYSVWKDLSLPELTPTCMTLELADRSITEPIGIAKDVRLMVGKFQFPADFMFMKVRLPFVLEGCHTFNLEPNFKIPQLLQPYDVNKIDFIDMAFVIVISQEVLGFSNVIASGNPTPYFEPIVSTASPNLTPFGDSDFLLMEEADSFLALEDVNFTENYPTYQILRGHPASRSNFLNSEPLTPPSPNHDNICLEVERAQTLEAKTV
ncbi:reverse transcriptase domain-containing protein [Tanacetum coccineum]